MIILETERLLLRHLEAADLDGLAAIYADAETTRYVGGTLTRTQTWEQLRRLDTMYRRRQFGLWATVLKATGAFIGRVGLIPWMIEGREEIEAAWLLDRAYWGQGLASEAGRASVEFAFKFLKVPRVISLIEADNVRSRRVAEKLGMRREREIEFRGFRPVVWSIEAAAAGPT